MQRSPDVGPLDALLVFVRGVVKAIRGFAFLVALAVAVIAAAFARDGLDTAELVVVGALLASPAMLLFFSGALAQLVRLPERLRRMPNQGADQIAELSRIAGEARRAGFRRTPSLLWRLRGVVGSSRDLVGFALPLRAFTPGFLGLTALAAFLGLILLGAGFIALIVLALG
jgi:hypothetical protein